MAGLTADALFPAFLTMSEEERSAFVKKAQATLKKRDTKKPAKKTVYDSVCAVLGEAWRPGNEEMLVAQIMNNK